MSVAQKHKTDDSHRAKRSMAEAYAQLRRKATLLVGSNGGPVELPESVLDFVVRLTSDLSARRSVAIIGSESTMTTIEACQVLGVSRQHLVNSLEGGAIPFHKVGTHRRIYAGDVFQYKGRRDERRRKAISRFSELESDQYFDS